MANHEQEVSVPSTMTDADMFAEAFGDGSEKSTATPDAGTANVESAAVTDGNADDPVESDSTATITRERDEFGRFKPKASDTQEPAEAEPLTQVEAPVEAAAQEPAAEQPPAKEDDHGNIPPWRLREIREARDAERAARVKAEGEAKAAWDQLEPTRREIAALKQQLHHLLNPQKQPEIPNQFEDPDGYTNHWEQRLAAIEGNLQKQLRQSRLENNLTIAAMTHKEEFPQAYEAFVAAVEAGDQALRHRVFGSADPGGSMVAWHREQRTLKEIGGDPTSYVQRKLDEALKDPAFLAKALEAARAQAGGQPVVQATTAQPAARPNTVTQLPPSLRSVPGAAASSQSTGVESLNDEELFDSIARR